MKNKEILKELKKLNNPRLLMPKIYSFDDVRKLLQAERKKVLELIDKAKVISENSYGEDDGTDEILLVKYLIDREALKREVEK